MTKGIRALPGPKPATYGLYARQQSHDVQRGKLARRTGEDGNEMALNTGQNQPSGRLLQSEQQDDVNRTQISSPPGAESTAMASGHNVQVTNQFSNDLSVNSLKNKNDLLSESEFTDGVLSKLLENDVEFEEDDNVDLDSNLLLWSGGINKSEIKAYGGSVNKLVVTAVQEQQDKIQEMARNLHLNVAKHIEVEEEGDIQHPAVTDSTSSLVGGNDPSLDEVIGSDSLVEGSTPSSHCAASVVGEFDHPQLTVAESGTSTHDSGENKDDLPVPEEHRGIISSVVSSDAGELFKPDGYNTKFDVSEPSLQIKHVCPSGNQWNTNVLIQQDSDQTQLGIDDNYLYTKIIRETAEIQQKERLDVHCKFGQKGIFHHHGDDNPTWQKNEVTYQFYLDSHLESVGIIRNKTVPIGTCFRVGPKRQGYLFTDFHVFNSIYPPGIHPTDTNIGYLSQDIVDVWFPETNKQKLYRLKPIFHSGCVKLDYAVLELEGNDFTKPFKNFGSVVIDQSPQYFLHGYHDNIRLIDDTVKVLNPSSRDIDIATQFCKNEGFVNAYTDCLCDYVCHSIIENEKIPILTKLRHGASGAPGFHLNDQGKPVVSFMYLRGYPREYYFLPWYSEKLKTFPSCLLVEQGLKMKDVHSSIEFVNPELAKELFRFH